MYAGSYLVLTKLNSIAAYSMDENELWLRHGFNTVYQISMSVFVTYPISVNYTERTLGLRYGIYLRNVFSSLPVSKYVHIKSVAERGKYVAMGEHEVERMIEQEQPSSSQKGLERSF